MWAESHAAAMIVLMTDRGGSEVTRVRLVCRMLMTLTIDKKRDSRLSGVGAVGHF